MEHTRNRRFSLEAIRARGTRVALEHAANKIAPRVQASTAVRTGETAGSTHVETGHRSQSGDRPAVRIVQGGASVPLNFRLRRNYMIRAVAGGV